MQIKLQIVSGTLVRNFNKLYVMYKIDPVQHKDITS